MTKESKIMTAVEATNIRKLILTANELGVTKEDIVTILPLTGSYIMIYYYGKDQNVVK